MKFRDARTIPPEQLYERRKQAVALRKKGMSFLEIAQIVGVRRDVVGQWYAMWQEGGMKALKVGARGAPKGSGLRLNTFEQARIRKNLIERSPDQLKMPFALWTRDAVRLLVKEIYGYDLPIRTIGHYLKRWNFTPQKPIKRAYERNDKKVNQWLEEAYPALSQRAKKEGAEIHWGDETGICSQDQIGRGYAPKGKTPVRKERGSRERINMMSTVTNQGKVRFMFYKETMNAQRFISFLRRLIKDAGRKIILILDNLRVHHAKLVKEWVAKRVDQIELHYLPSYSPDLNPDEYLNCDLKGELSRKPGVRQKGKFQDEAKSFMRKLAKSPARVKSYFRAKPIQYAADAA